MTKRAIVGLIIGCSAMMSAPGVANKLWSASLTNWRFYMDNGVAYVQAANMPANCQYQRAYIDTSATVYTPTNQRDLYAFVLAQSLAGNTLSIVVDDSETNCRVYGASN
jgi:hypothetical protein